MVIKINQQDIIQAAQDDFRKQKKYDNAYDRQAGFKAGVEWAQKEIQRLSQNQPTAEASTGNGGSILFRQ